MRTSRSPTTLMTANGEVTVILLEETPAVLYFGRLCEDHGFSYYWTSGRKPQLTKKGKKIDCNISNYVPFVVPALSASSSSTTPSPTYPSSSSQDSVFDVNRYTVNPVQERCGSTSGELRGDPLHETTETKNKNINGESEEVQRDISHDMPDWLHANTSKILQPKEVEVRVRTYGETRCTIYYMNCWTGCWSSEKFGR